MTATVDGTARRDVVARIRVQSGDAPSTKVEYLTAAATDDYDTWCENGSICARELNKYTVEVKGNGAYGDQDGVIGRIDVILKQSFNGPWPRWRAVWIWDSGPTIYPVDYDVLCRVNRKGPDGHCGGLDMNFDAISKKHKRSSYPTSNASKYSYNSEELKGGTRYHDEAAGSFKAYGYPMTFYLGVLHTGRWRYCSRNCVYYQVPWVP